ncbi:MAG: fasciclin domain-containing protein [Pricia sp.]
MKNLLLSTMAIALTAGTAFAANTETSDPTPEQTKVVVQDTPNIVGVAAGNENFSTLVAAVKAADLVKTLSSEGPFTVFAPTNAAFEALPEGTVDTLLKPESKDALISILTYHVVSGKFMAADVVKAIKDNGGEYVVETVNGNKLMLTLDGDSVVLTDAKGGTSTVAQADVAASNGVIHAIDAVVMPE